MTVYLFDNIKAVIADVEPRAYTQKTVLGGMITASLSVAYTETLEVAHYFGSRDIDDESIFHMYRISSLRKGDTATELYGVHILFDELQASVLRDIRPQNVTAGVALGRILEFSQWHLGVNQATRTASSTYYYQSRLSAFWNFLQVWQVEFRPRLVFVDGQIVGRYIDIYDQISGDAGKWFEYGDRLITVTAEQANEGIYTALIGRGKGEEVGGGFGRRTMFTDVAWSTASGNPVDKPAGQDYVALPSSVAVFGMREGVVEFPDIEDPAALLQATYNELLNRARPRVEFYADALETGRIEIGETVTIVRDDLGIRYKTRVFELERNFLNPTIKSFRFGDKISVSSADRLKYTAQEIKQQESAYWSLFEQNRQAIIKSYINGDASEYRLLIGNEYGLPAGTYSFDKPIDQNPTSVIYIGAGKFLIANSKLPNGEWDWRAFGSGDGLGAALVTADNIDANGIRADQIIASDNQSAEVKFTQLTGQGIELVERANQADASAQQINATIGIVDGTLQTAVTELDDLKTMQAAMLQDQESWRIIVETIQTETGQNTVTLDDVRKYMKFDQDFLTIGKEGSPLEIQITNEAVNFMDGGERVAWISGQQLHIGSAVIVDRLTVGNHMLVKHDATEITIVKWANG